MQGLMNWRKAVAVAIPVPGRTFCVLPRAEARLVWEEHDMCFVHVHTFMGVWFS